MRVCGSRTMRINNEEVLVDHMWGRLKGGFSVYSLLHLFVGSYREQWLACSLWGITKSWSREDTVSIAFLALLAQARTDGLQA